MCGWMKNLRLHGFDDGGRAPLSQSACDHGQCNLVETSGKTEIMMLLKYLLLIFLPAIVYSTITIKIQAGTNTRDVSVTFKGKDKALISDHERKMFNITDEDLKNITERINGVPCTDTFVRAPTPFGDIYMKYGWDEVERVVEPISSRIVSINATPVLLASTRYTNHDSSPVTYRNNLLKPLTGSETVKHNWKGDYNLTLEKGVNYDVNFGTGSAGGLMSLRYTSRFGEDDYQERNVTFGPTARSTFSVNPNSTIVEYLYTIKGKMEVEVQYKATIKGDVFCNYENPYNDHHFYGIDVNYLLNKGELGRQLHFYENIAVKFYIHASMLMGDEKTGVPIKSVGDGIVQA